MNRFPHACSSIQVLLEGIQTRMQLDCRDPALSFDRNLVSIVTDTSVLSLPDDVTGMVGLSFLRQFSRWGAERSGNGWRFFLSNSEE